MRADLVNVAVTRPLAVVFGSLGFVYDGDVLYIRIPDSGRAFGGSLKIDQAALERSRFRVARKLRARAMGWPVVPVDMSPVKTSKGSGNRSLGKRQVTRTPAER